MYSVKDVAEILGMSSHAVRYYTDIGLIPTVRRDSKNQRLFDEEALNWLTGVRHLRNCGMSINDVRHYVALCLKGDSTIEQRAAIIHNLKNFAEVQLEEAQRRVNYLTEKTQHYQKIVNGLVPDNTNPAKWHRLEDLKPTGFVGLEKKAAIGKKQKVAIKQ